MVCQKAFGIQLPSAPYCFRRLGDETIPFVCIARTRTLRLRSWSGPGLSAASRDWRWHRAGLLSSLLLPVSLWLPVSSLRCDRSSSCRCVAAASGGGRARGDIASTASRDGQSFREPRLNTPLGSTNDGPRAAPSDLHPAAPSDHHLAAPSERSDCACFTTTMMESRVWMLKQMTLVGRGENEQRSRPHKQLLAQSVLWGESSPGEPHHCSDRNTSLDPHLPEWLWTGTVLSVGEALQATAFSRSRQR
jgi:hypothetical protein